jgi:hypothetical protein
MKHHIFDYNNFDNQKICIKNPESRNNNITIPVSYNKSNTILFKTPKIYMPFKPNITNNLGGYLRLSFDNIKIDHNLKGFYDFINKTDDYLIKKLEELKIIKSFSKVNFKRTIKHNENGFYPDYFNLNFNNSDVKCFDSNLNSIPIEEIDGNFYAYFVIELYGFYYNKKMKQIRLIWNLVQFKLDKIKQVINECLFLDEDSTSTSTSIIKNSIEEQLKPKVILKNHPLLEKYFKMLSVGIPKQAVINKMILLNIDYKYLDYPADTDINKLPLDLLNKLQETESGSSSSLTLSNLEFKESNENQDNQNKQDITNVSLLLHLKQKLNKVSDEPSLKIKLLKKNINTNLPVPSLEDIQNARKRILEKNNS